MHAEIDSLKTNTKILKFSLTKSLVRDGDLQGTGFLCLHSSLDILVSNLGLGTLLCVLRCLVWWDLRTVTVGCRESNCNLS
ncbi:hypothetical protein VNO80_06321 [Phaseolus coccineus]|uniref:Uncharacterized protein n=1 Tax=Phaseolus coccineus TaxID=3886 RepID=A0AAN9NGN9_PHACN